MISQSPCISNHNHGMPYLVQSCLMVLILPSEIMWNSLLLLSYKHLCQHAAHSKRDEL